MVAGQCGRVTLWTLVSVEVCVCVRCLLYTSDAADEEESVDRGGRRSDRKEKDDKEK